MRSSSSSESLPPVASKNLMPFPSYGFCEALMTTPTSRPPHPAESTRPPIPASPQTRHPSFQRINRRADIVNANDTRPIDHRHHGERHTAIHPLTRRAARQPPHNRLAGQSYHYGQL